MDGSAFDRLSRAFVAEANRRRLFGLLTSVPLLGLLSGVDVAEARPGRKSHRQHARHQHRHTQTQRRKRVREDTHSEACIPTGQRCPARKARGKKGKKLGCNQCCQHLVVTDVRGKKVCGCLPNGQACTSDTAASSCCSGSCDGATCRPRPCSATHSCPQCQTCNTITGLCDALADGTNCDDGNACTQTDTCQGGVCVGSAPVVCPPAPNECQIAGTCDPATGLCSDPTPKPNRTLCSGGNICCDGACCSGCCSAIGNSGGACGACLVFATSATQNANLGGLDGADDTCQSLADAATPTPLPGTYKAWLSTGNGPNECPANGRFRQSPMPYVLPDAGHTQVAADWADLTSCAGGCLQHAINVTEAGVALVGPGSAWSNTNVDGFVAVSGFDCDGWTSSDMDFGRVGATNLSNGAWADAASIFCAVDTARLYCFQQD